MMTRTQGFTLWLTGLPGAGKTTLVRGLAPELSERGLAVEIPDGDAVRETLSKELGFSKADRDTNIRRIGFVARLLSRNGVVVLVAAVSSYRAVREEVRRVQEAPFVEVFVDCPVEETIRRDPKGLYARAQRGELKAMTSVSDPYEPPISPDIHVRTTELSVDAAVAQVLKALRARSLVPAAAGARS